MKLSQLILVCLSVLILNGCVVSGAPIVDYYHGKDRCGIACYSHNPQGIFKLSSQPYLEGMVTVQGKYDKQVCKPMSYENADISVLPKFRELCDAQIQGCESAKRTTGKGCWADGDTGDMYVIPKH